MSEGSHRSDLARAGLPPAIRPATSPKPCAILDPTPASNEPVEKCLALIATRNFIPFAKLTAQTFLAHHADFQIFLLLVDGEASDREAFREGSVVLLSDLALPKAGWYTVKFTAPELSNALKPVFLKYLARFVRKAIYLDCDIVIFSPLTEMIELLEANDLVLVPHMLALPPRPEQHWVHPTRADTFNAGIINAGSFALNLSRSEAFLSFWKTRILRPALSTETLDIRRTSNI